MSELEKSIEGLRLYNRWRRGDEEIPPPHPYEVGEMLDTLCDQAERLQQAAQAVVDRWEQPSWKDTEPTAVVIYKLRDILGREAS